LKTIRLVMLVHGGAGSRRMTAAQRVCLEDALVTGYGRLRQGASSLEAVEASIRVLEASGIFNAGLGARFQLDGVRRLDAAVMEGHGLRAGAVAGIQEVRHPITAARLVMERTAHVLLAGESATRFARYFKLERQGGRSAARSRSAASRHDRVARSTLALFRDMAGRARLGRETVGAVAIDLSGTVAAGASTGGIDFMLPGRVGDTPLIGCGVYADNEAGAVSMTGLGESIIRIAVAKEIVDRLSIGANPAAAARQSLHRVVSRVDGAAGALVLAPTGRIAIRHTTPRMLAGYWRGTGKPIVNDRFS